MNWDELCPYCESAEVDCRNSEQGIDHYICEDCKKFFTIHYKLNKIVKEEEYEQTI